MPMYDFECDGCGHASIEFATMANSTPIGDSVACPICGETQYRRRVSLVHTDLKEFHTPIEMYSIGLNTDEEIKDFKRRCPDVDVSLDEADPMYGVPVARNRKQKLTALKAVGFVEKK